MLSAVLSKIATIHPLMKVLVFCVTGIRSTLLELKLELKESLLIMRDRPLINRNVRSTPLYLFELILDLNYQYLKWLDNEKMYPVRNVSPMISKTLFSLSGHYTIHLIEIN